MHHSPVILTIFSTLLSLPRWVSVAGQGQFTFNGSTLSWTAVPEPANLLIGGLLGLGLLRRRRGA